MHRTNSEMISEKPEVLVIIPARGGSKGIPGKNVRKVGGMPLIAYSIRVALRSRLVTRVIVSTDSQEIAEVALSYGAEVPFLRPEQMAEDDSNIGDAVNYTTARLKREEGYSYKALITLYPTHPFRSVKVLDHLIGKTLEGYSPVKTVKVVAHDRHSILCEDGNGFLQSCMHQNTFVSAGNRKHYCRSYGYFIGVFGHLQSKPYIYALEDPVSLIDIDTYKDLCLARQVIEKGMYEMGEEMER